MKYKKIIQKKVITTKSNKKKEFLIIDKNYLISGYNLNFTLYIKNKNGKIVPYIEKSTIINEKKISQVSEIYISIDEKDKFDTFLEQHLQSLINDDDLNTDEKVKLLYKSATILTNSLYENPEALENVQRSKQIVNPIIQSIINSNTTIQSYMKILAYDYYTHTHSLNVSIYSLCLGYHLGLEKSALTQLGRAALLHDLGKSRVDHNIINKKTQLSDDEFRAVQMHPSHGYDIALKIGINDIRILNGIRHHHEKLNGKGYPDGLKSQEISLFARIIGVCDVFDALTTERSYKKAMKSYEALSLMQKDMSEHLDIEILKTFIKMLRD